MFHKISPEQAGISSRVVEGFIRSLERRGLAMHSVLLMKGNDIFGEFYWHPFGQDTCHRMYSQTKSFVGIAIVLLEEDGLLHLDDAICTYFPDKVERELPPYLRELTIRQMLTMRTAGITPSWFFHADPDRTHLYFQENRADHPAGTFWKYDSPASQVLCALVERLSGKSLFDFLNERIFRHLGTFRTATILKTPNGDSWGDSALLCTSRDMASFVRLLVKGGVHEGKRLIPEGYLKEACSCVTYNHETPFSAYDEAGYGYQIWQTQMGGFAFHGMGGQFSIGIPELDFTVVVTGDNQGHRSAGQLLFAAIEEFLVLDMSSTPLPTDDAAYASLAERTADLRLAACAGEPVSEMATEIDGQTYEMGENPYGWKWFSFALTDGASGVLRYENAQGEKELPFAFGENIFCKFPQYGYSDGVGGVRTTDGFLYDCAVSAGWLCANVLSLRVQIIDRYFGNLFMMFAFKGDEVAISMVKNAEDFLNEYHGRAMARRRKDVAVTGL
jgi:CubicO group peptidase (beta-lactamase class C family)